MPFTPMFIIDLYKGGSHLSYQQLINLIGRVNRFNTIFNGKIDGLKGIVSNIYFVKRVGINSNYEEFIPERLKIESTSNKRDDPVEKPYLINSKNKIEDIEKKSLSVLLEQPIEGKKGEFKTNIEKIMMTKIFLI